MSYNQFLLDMLEGKTEAEGVVITLRNGVQFGGKLKVVEVKERPFQDNPRYADDEYMRDYEENNSYFVVESEMQDPNTKKVFVVKNHVCADEVVAIGKASERQVQPVRSSSLIVDR